MAREGWRESENERFRECYRGSWGYGKGQEEFNRTRKGWRGPGWGGESHGRVMRSMERVVSLKKGRESYEGMEGVRESWKGPGRVREDRNN